MPRRPVIVIPGIKGTGLENIYELPPHTTWSAAEAVEQSLFGPHFDQIALDEHGESDESDLVVNRASQLIGLAYASLVSSLRGRQDEPVKLPVYVFPYDWRYPVTQNAEALVRYVNRLQRKNLKAIAPWDQAFNFVCHSMGGLVFRAFLAAWGPANPGKSLPVGKVVFIASPHQGSLDAVEGMIRGETVIFGGKKAIRKLARTFPGVYDLLPRLERAVVRPDGTALDVFDVKNWQGNVTDQNDPDDYQVLARHLAEAAERLAALPDPRAPLAGNLLVVYGCDPGSTLRRVTVMPSQNGVENWYDFDHPQRGDGDHVVPVESATLAGTPSVEVHKDDIGYFDFKARLLSMHAALPSLDEVQTVVARFFNDRSGTDLLPKGVDPGRYHPLPPA